MVFLLKPHLIISRFVLTTIDLIFVLINILIPKWIIRAVLNNNIDNVVKILFYSLIFNLI